MLFEDEEHEEQKLAVVASLGNHLISQSSLLKDATNSH